MPSSARSTTAWGRASHAAALAARCRELLGPVDGPVAIVAPGVPALAGALAASFPLAADGAAAGAAVISFLGTPARPVERERTLCELRSQLQADAPLVLVDHNQPRVAWRRALAMLGLAAARLGPARGRYPAARELAAMGFRVERLVLAAGERVQLVRARR